MKVEIPNQLLVKVSGMVSRGIKEAEINEDGILVFTLTDGTKIELGSVKGDQGPRGESGVYVGTGEMPEGCNVQIDPSGEAFEFIQPPKTASIGQALLVKSIDETGKPTEWETGEVKGGSGGTSDHSKLSNRDAADQHPIGAITGLEAALANIPPTDAFIVTLTKDKGGTYSVDKTFAEIQAALQSNRATYLYVNVTSMFLPLVLRAPEDGVIFGYISISSMNVRSIFVVVHNDDRVEIQQKILSKLPNPNALTFTGAVTGSYDGSAPLSVEIPGGGSGNNDWELLADVTLTEDVATIAITQTPSGEAFSVRELVIIGTPISDGTNKTVQFAPYATEIKYGVELMSLGEVLSSTDGGTSYLSALIQVLPEVVYSRTQYNPYDNSDVGYANKINASRLRNEANVSFAENGDPITKFAIGVWSSGTAGVFRAGTKMRVYGR